MFQQERPHFTVPPHTGRISTEGALMIPPVAVRWTVWALRGHGREECTCPGASLPEGTRETESLRQMGGGAVPSVPNCTPDLLRGGLRFGI